MKGYHIDKPSEEDTEEEEEDDSKPSAKKSPGFLGSLSAILHREEEEDDDDRLITTIGNPYLLNIAFANLIENNCKYSTNHSSIVQISFRDQWSVVRMSDNGWGMSKEDKKNIFKLFYRGENEKAADGHGIGMTLAQKIIHLHNGKIAVYSEQGRGTLFVVELKHISIK